MKNDVKRLHVSAGAFPEEQFYNAKLYIKSDYEFKPALLEIEQALENFEIDVKSKQLPTNQRHKPQPNVTLNQHKLLLHLGNNNDTWIVILVNKDLNLVVLERVVCIESACKEHPHNKRNYK